MDTIDIDTSGAIEPAWPKWLIQQVSASEIGTISRLRRVGLTVMSRSCVTICGLARDLGRVAPLTMARIRFLGRRFSDYRVVIVENDSVDHTPATIDRWATTDSRITILRPASGLPRFGPVRWRARTECLAYLRSVYHAHILSELSNFSHVIVVDMDMQGGWLLDGVATTFAHSGWGAVTSNGLLFVPIRRAGKIVAYKQVYYDSWALRLPGHGSAYKNATINALNILPGKQLIPLLSGFGGLAVYTIQAFKSSYYSGEDCEHTGFHVRMQEQGHGIFMNPTQMVFYNQVPEDRILITGSSTAFNGDCDDFRGQCEK